MSRVFPLVGLRLILFQYLTIAFLGIETCQARIGETSEECVMRYGQSVKSRQLPTGVDERVDVFKKDGILVAVIFKGKIAQADLYRNQDGTDFSDSQEKMLLEIEANGGIWEKKDNPQFKDAWRKSDGASAICTGKAMLFITQEYLSEREADKSGASLFN